MSVNADRLMFHARAFFSPQMAFLGLSTVFLFVACRLILLVWQSVALDKPFPIEHVKPFPRRQYKSQQLHSLQLRMNFRSWLTIYR